MTDLPQAAIDAAAEAVADKFDAWTTREASDVIFTVLEPAAPHIATAKDAVITNLRNALKEAAHEMDRRYEMGAAAERERIRQLALQRQAICSFDPSSLMTVTATGTLTLFATLLEPDKTPGPPGSDLRTNELTEGDLHA